MDDKTSDLFFGVVVIWVGCFGRNQFAILRSVVEAFGHRLRGGFFISVRSDDRSYDLGRVKR